MFHMVNPSGNVYQNVITEQKRDERLAAGWKLVEEENFRESGFINCKQRENRQSVPIKLKIR